MGKIVYAGFAPHPPLLVEEVGGSYLEHVKNTRLSMDKMAERLAGSDPDTLIIITPHSQAFRYAIGINMSPNLKGSFSRFGAPSVKFEKSNDTKLAASIMEEAKRNGVPVVSLNDHDSDLSLDHGTMVPLYYIDKEIDLSLVVISIGFLAREELYSFGKALRAAVENSDRDAALIASGDLSHKLTPDAPAGFNRKGREFDLLIKSSLEDSSFKEILDIPERLSEEAGECGLRPLIMFLGAMEGISDSAEVLSYEGPLGVGYLVAEFKLEGSKPFLVGLAEESLKYYLEKGEIMPLPKDSPEEFLMKAGAFVSLKKDGKLRGCIGTVEPARSTLLEEVIYNAVSAGISDPRFPPVEPKELPELKASVDVLMPPEPVKDLDELDPEEYGVIVRKGPRTGLLLPNLDGIDTYEKQLKIALQKAGIDPLSHYTVEKFEVKRYE